jgi:hypothetical protein
MANGADLRPRRDDVTPSAIGEATTTCDAARGGDGCRAAPSIVDAARRIVGSIGADDANQVEPDQHGRAARRSRVDRALDRRVRVDASGRDACADRSDDEPSFESHAQLRDAVPVAIL